MQKYITVLLKFSTEAYFSQILEKTGFRQNSYNIQHYTDKNKHQHKYSHFCI